MKRLLAQLSNWRLQHILIISFALTTAITIVVGSLMTSSVINNYLEEAQASLEGMSRGSVILKEFIEEMDMAYGAADLIVARAGAITISELCHIGKPAILIPSPNVAEDHQTRNAQSLVRQGAAVYIPDREASGMMPAALELLGDEKKQKELSEKIKSLAMPDSGGRIAEEIISLMKG